MRGLPLLSQPSLRQQRALMLIVPLAAVLVVGRQFYLSRFHDLSTWKGGGMGMFAANDGADARYTKIYLITPDGKREPLTQLSETQIDLNTRAIEFPLRSNFLRAARAIVHTNWTPMK